MQLDGSRLYDVEHFVACLGSRCPCTHCPFQSLASHARLDGSRCVGQNSTSAHRPRHFCSEIVRSFPAGSGRSSTPLVALTQRRSRYDFLLQSWLTDICQKPLNSLKRPLFLSQTKSRSNQKQMVRQGAVSDSVVATVTFMLASSILMGTPAPQAEKVLRKLRSSAPVHAEHVHSDYRRTKTPKLPKARTP